ncbi:MAG: Fic family protein [Actinobacteria bacterium]|nr:Fic family protein [Actinomycetota bacterium]
MKSFETGFIEGQPVTQGLIKTIRAIGEYKGKQELFKEQAPQVLETLRQTAVIQSAEASNRIEGVIAPIERIKELIDEKTTPANRSEQEIAGYRDVLNAIHVNYAHITLTTNTPLNFHRDLYRYVGGKGSCWKALDNDIIKVNPDGTTEVRFKPVPACETPEAMENLHDRFNKLWHSERVEPLLLIQSYVLDFLCIHPFDDGNGRIARLLELLLLYKAGFEVGRYISVEQIIERSKESYYDALYKSSQGWHEGKHSLIPWWEYSLGVVLDAYKEFERRVGLVTTSKGAKTAMVLDAISNIHGEFSVKNLQELCPTVGIDHIRKILRREREAGRLECLGRGPDSRWTKK